MPNEAVLEQSRFVPGWLHIRHEASTERLDEIGLMRMHCHAVEVCYLVPMLRTNRTDPPRMRSKRPHIAHTERSK